MGRKDMGGWWWKERKRGRNERGQLRLRWGVENWESNEHLRRENDASRRTPATVPSLHIHGHYDDAVTYKQILG